VLKPAVKYHRVAQKSAPRDNHWHCHARAHGPTAKSRRRTRAWIEIWNRGWNLHSVRRGRGREPI